MKVRKNKHKILDRMANPSWHTESNKMWFIRDTERCKSYSPWCPDCNAKLFYKQLHRFPYSYQEWRQFELHQIAHDEVARKMLEAQSNQVDKEMSDAAKFLELSNQLEDFK
jgi:hypothetical protein